MIQQQNVTRDLLMSMHVCKHWTVTLSLVTVRKRPHFLMNYAVLATDQHGIIMYIIICTGISYATLGVGCGVGGYPPPPHPTAVELFCNSWDYAGWLLNRGSLFMSV